LTQYISSIDLQPFKDGLTMVITEMGFNAWTTQRGIANKDFWANLGYSNARSKTNGWQLWYGMPQRLTEQHEKRGIDGGLG
jgi:hypothetical protein